MQFCIQLYVGVSKIIPYLQANPYRLKTENINSVIFISAITNANDFFRLGFLRNKRACCMLMFFSTEFCLK